MLEALGVRIDLSPADVAASIDQVGFGFLFAQAHHPAMRYAGPVRRELGVRTVFNLLGPLTNPAGARRQVMGVYSANLVEPLAHVLAQLGCDHALVVHGAGGLDELTPTGENLMAEVRGREVTLTTLDPSPLADGPVPGSLADLRVEGGPVENAAVIRTVFDGEHGPRRDAVILNAAAAMLVGAAVDDFEAGVELAVETIDSGAAQRKLDDLVAFTRERGTGMSGYLQELGDELRQSPPAAPRGFAAALRAGSCVSVIAEIKRASPSQGAIAPDADIAATAARYAAGGAAAMSVLCAERDFGGSLEYLRQARAAAPLPALAKDFTLYPEQVAQQRLGGADAILVILAMVADDEARTAARHRNAPGHGRPGRGARRARMRTGDRPGCRDRRRERPRPRDDGDRHPPPAGTRGRPSRHDDPRRRVGHREPRGGRGRPRCRRRRRAGGYRADAHSRPARRAGQRGAAMSVLVKICGLTREEDVDAAVAAGADLVGFVLAPESPRAVTPNAPPSWPRGVPEQRADGGGGLGGQRP